MIKTVSIIGSGLAAKAVLLSFANFFEQTAEQTQWRINVIAPETKHTGSALVGESLPPSVEPLLAQLGVWDAFKALDYPPSFTRYTCWENDHLIPSYERQNPNGYGWIINRRAFEQLLWTQINRRVEKIDRYWLDRYQHTLKQSEKTPQGWLLTLSDNQQIKSDFVIDCSGRACTFARDRSPRLKASTMVAGCDFLAPLNADVERTAGVMIEAVVNGWWYSSLLPTGQLAVAYFTDRALMPQDFCRDEGVWKNALSQAKYTQMRIDTGEFTQVNQPRIKDASTSCLEQAGGELWLACGDAAITLDPLSAHGMATALWSGLKAAQACVATLQGDHSLHAEYVASVAKNWQLYHQQRTNIYKTQQRFTDSQFWLSK